MNELQRTLIGNGVAASPERILEAIDENIARRRVEGTPHTIFEEVWHLAFWQEISLKWMNGEAAAYPEQAAEIAGDPHRLAETVMCPTRPGEESRLYPALDQMISLAGHNAYHLGRIVLLRQIFGCWPPPAGGDTW